MLLIFYAIIVILGHYTFSLQRVTYNLGREFNEPQSTFDPLLPNWLLPLQYTLMAGKYGILAYMAFYLNQAGNAIFLFIIAAIIHIACPLFSADLYFRMFYEKARYIQETQHNELGSEYIRILQSSRLFRSFNV